METSSTEEQQQQAEQLNQARKAHESKVLIQAYLQILAATMPQAERQALMSDPVSACLLTSSPVACDIFRGFPDEGERQALLEDVSPPVDYNPRGRFLPDEGPSPSSTGYSMISESFPDDGLPPPRSSSSSSTSATVVNNGTTTHFVWMARTMAFFVAIVSIGLGLSHI